MPEPLQALPTSPKRRRSLWLIIIAIIAIVIYAYTQLTLFVVQPIGAVPEGVTLVILRPNAMEFIDSADAVCKRAQGSVNLLCRGIVLGAVAENSTVLLRLPYLEFLYLMSTDGVTYRGVAE